MIYIKYTHTKMKRMIIRSYKSKYRLVYISFDYSETSLLNSNYKIIHTVNIKITLISLNDKNP